MPLGREQPRGVGEQPDSVDVGDVEAVGTPTGDHPDVGLAGPHGLEHGGVQRHRTRAAHGHRRAGGRRRGVEARPDGRGQLVEQRGAPVGPRQRPGGGGVRLGEREQDLEDLTVAPDGGDGGVDGGRVLVVAAGRELDEGQVLADERDEHLDVARREAPALRDGAREVGAGHRVVPRAPHLPDVVEQRGDEEQVRAGRPSHQPGRAHDGLDEVAVHGVAVDRTALGSRPDGCPLGQPPLDDADLVQALPHADQPRPGRQEVAEQVTARRGPRVRVRGCGAGEVVEGRRGEGQPGPGRDDAGAQRHPGVALGESGRAEHDLAVAGEQAVAERGHPRPAGPDPQGAGALGLARAAQGAVEGVADEAAGTARPR